MYRSLISRDGVKTCRFLACENGKNEAATGTQPLRKTLDVFQELIEKSVTFAGRGQIKRIHFDARSGAMPLLYFNPNEQCDPFAWKDDNERDEAMEYDRLQQVKKPRLTISAPSAVNENNQTA